MPLKVLLAVLSLRAASQAQDLAVYPSNENAPYDTHPSNAQYDARLAGLLDRKTGLYASSRSFTPGRTSWRTDVRLERSETFGEEAWEASAQSAAVALNQVGDFIAVSNLSLARTPFAVEMWVRRNRNADATRQVLASQGVRKVGQGFEWAITSNALEFTFFASAKATCGARRALAPEPGTWTHLAVSYDDGKVPVSVAAQTTQLRQRRTLQVRTASVFRDGKLVGSCRMSRQYLGPARGASASWSDLRFGVGAGRTSMDEAGLAFRGAMAEIRVWRGAALSARLLRAFHTLSGEASFSTHPARHFLVGSWLGRGVTSTDEEMRRLADASTHNNHARMMGRTLVITGPPRRVVYVEDVAVAVEEDLVRAARRDGPVGGVRWYGQVPDAQSMHGTIAEYRPMSSARQHSTSVGKYVAANRPNNAWNLAAK